MENYYPRLVPSHAVLLRLSLEAEGAEGTEGAAAVAQARVVGPRILLMAQVRHRLAPVMVVGVPLLPPACEHVCGAPPPSAELAHLIVSR